MRKLILLLVCIASITCIISCTTEPISDSKNQYQKINPNVSKNATDSIGGGDKGTTHG